MLGVGAFCVRVLEGEERKEMAEQEGKKRFCRKNLSASWRVGGEKKYTSDIKRIKMQQKQAQFMWMWNH